MARNVMKERRNDLYKAILELKDLQECMDFFEDICALTELQSMEQRFEVAHMLNDNKVYTEIMEKTNASTATISRVNRMLHSGTGCLVSVLDRMKEKGNI
ncbi:MAG: YerC/YecD family TrpR-related protein [Lachnospiraceae bacterium]|nr:YerC/YecD family TrpR-related protein [Lachnospiraceae bacterium]